MDIVSLFYERLESVSAQKTPLVFLTNGSAVGYTWHDYRNKAIYIAEWLKRNGIKKGDFVAIIPLNLPESFFAMLGTILIGAVPVPINIQLLKEPGFVDLMKIVNDCKPKLVLINESLEKHLLGTGIDYHAIERIMVKSKVLLSGLGHRLTYYPDSYPMAGSNDLLIMPYTSGTSGQPKGVMLTQKNILNRLEAISDVLSVTENERILSYLPLGHIAELIATFFGQIYSGYTVYFTEYAKDTIDNKEKFRKKFPAVLKQVQPTIFIGVPRIWSSFRKEIESKIKKIPMCSLMTPRWLKRRIIRTGLGFGHTKIFVSAASKISDDDFQFFAKLGISINDIYGQTETAGPLTLNGNILGPKNKIEIMENAEIAVTGDCVMAGYYQNPSANARVFSKNKAGETIYHTGDTGMLRCGKIFWTGRIGNGFKLANGEYVNPDKIELLEEKIRKIDQRISEVIICGINKPHLVALIFSDVKNSAFQDLFEKIKSKLPQIGEGMHKIKNFMILSSVELEMTPTMKIKREQMLKKFELVINRMFQ